MINWTRTISPRLVNEARVGVNNLMLNNGGADKGRATSPANWACRTPDPGCFPSPASPIPAGLGNANIGTQQLFATTTYHYADNLTVIRGRHMMKMGANILRQEMNVFYSGNNGRSGYMDFNGRFTAANAISPAGKQVGEADFVLGLPDDLGRGLQNGTWGQRTTIWGFYFQDDWRVTNNLTLNLGLRWEYHTPLVEVEDRQANFGLFSGQLELAGQNGNSRALYNSVQEGLPAAPRLRLYPGHPEQENGGSRRVYHLLVHGRHRHQPPSPVESASRRGDHHALQHAGRYLSQDHAGPGPFRLEQPGPLSQRHHPPVGSQPPARRSTTVEPHHGVPVAVQQRHSASGTSDSMART